MAAKTTLVTVALISAQLLLRASTPTMAVSIPPGTTPGTTVPSAPAPDEEAAEVPAECMKVVQQAGPCCSPRQPPERGVPECWGVLHGVVDTCQRELFLDSVGQLYAPLLTHFCGIPAPSGRSSNSRSSCLRVASQGIPDF